MKVHGFRCLYEGAWQGLEAYISQHPDAEFSHGICADCVEQLYPEFVKKRARSNAQN